ncbi:MAG: AI-2E family transporter [Ignavibacteriae bacterium]|nr:AI-2E family transporter [Ignavibacteriota bacterium]MCB9242849.1 AI-2E family transporter [Ignavibacteriales bacterium]
MDLKSPQNTKYLRALTIIASILLVGFAVFVLKELQGILVPLVIAIFIALLFQPFYRWMKSKKIPGFVAIIVIILIIVIISNITSVFVYAGINSITANSVYYETKFTEMYMNAAHFLKISPDQIASIQESLQLKNLMMESSVTGAVSGIFSGILSIFSNFVLILIYVIFLLSEFGSMRKRIVKAFTQEKASALYKTFTDIFDDVRKYIIGKTLLSLAQAIVIWVILFFAGVEFAFMWAFIFFITDYIPYIGSIVVTVFVGFAMIFQFGDFLYPVFIVVLLTVVQNVKGNMVEPKVLGDRLDLSPILLLVSLLFWGYVWGIVGMILAYPIMSMIKIVLMNFPQTRSIAILMSYNLTSKNYMEMKESSKLDRLLKKTKIKDKLTEE